MAGKGRSLHQLGAVHQVPAVLGLKDTEECIHMVKMLTIAHIQNDRV